MIRSVAVDDEPLALAVIQKYCRDLPGIHLEESFTDAISALNYLRQNTIDLLFLDILMPDISGFQLLQQLENPPLVIFTTAFTQYAVRGFELEAVDYLVKPVNFERFAAAVGKANKWILMKHSPGLKNEADHLVVKSGYSRVNIRLDDILFIEGQDDYIKITLAGGQKPVMSLMSLKMIQEKLPPDQFIRVHRSFIVSALKIKSIRKKIIYFESGSVPIGESYSGVLKPWLSE